MICVSTLYAKPFPQPRYFLPNPTDGTEFYDGYFASIFQLIADETGITFEYVVVDDVRIDTLYVFVLTSMSGAV